MVNFKEGKIYKIENIQLGLTYFGSTCSSLTKRFKVHRSNSKNDNLNNSSKLLFESGEPYIELVENVPTTSNIYLLERERYYVENFSCVNFNIPGRSKDENDIYQKKYQKKYRYDNKDKARAYQKIYRIENLEKLKLYQKMYNSKHKL
jgi:hypothetical protein